MRERGLEPLLQCQVMAKKERLICEVQSYVGRCVLGRSRFRIYITSGFRDMHKKVILGRNRFLVLL